MSSGSTVITYCRGAGVVWYPPLNESFPSIRPQNSLNGPWKWDLPRPTYHKTLKITTPPNTTTLVECCRCIRRFPRPEGSERKDTADNRKDIVSSPERFGNLQGPHVSGPDVYYSRPHRWGVFQDPDSSLRFQPLSLFLFAKLRFLLGIVLFWLPLTIKACVSYVFLNY